jgi:cytochrome P450
VPLDTIGRRTPRWSARTWTPHMYPWVPSTVPDPAEHARYRSILNPRFTPLALAPVTAAVQDHAVALVDAVADKGEWDGIADIARPLASQTLLTLLGFPSTDLDTVIGLLDRYRVHRDDPKTNHQHVVDYVAHTIPQADSTGVVAALLVEVDVGQAGLHESHGCPLLSGGAQ